MPKYKFIITYSDGEEYDSSDYDELFDDEDEAEEEAYETIGLRDVGAEILHMSNPGDYDYDEDREAEVEVIEIED